MTDVVCRTGCESFGTSAGTYCVNTTSAPAGHLLLKEKALAIIRHFPDCTYNAGSLRKRLLLEEKLSWIRRRRSHD